MKEIKSDSLLGRMFLKERKDLTYEEAKMMLMTSRGAIVDMLDLALQFGDISQKERTIIYHRLIDWNSLDDCGKKFGVTRERIRQIEAKVEEKMRQLCKNPLNEARMEGKAQVRLS